MDESVIRAIARWPNVPSVYGWLRLDRRGQWWIKSGRVKSPAVNDGMPAFERISNSAVNEFINRNYERDGQGRWYFQNGPQRVFVSFEYTPLVFRIDERARGLISHHGRAPGKIAQAYFDENGSLLLHTDLGAGVVSDRDLAAALDGLAGDDDRPVDAEALHAEIVAGNTRKVRLFGAPLDLSPLRSADAPSRFGFVADPRPAPGEPEC